MNQVVREGQRQAFPHEYPIAEFRVDAVDTPAAFASSDPAHYFEQDPLSDARPGDCDAYLNADPQAVVKEIRHDLQIRRPKDGVAGVLDRSDRVW